MLERATPLDEWVLPGVRWHSRAGVITIAILVPAFGIVAQFIGLGIPDPALPLGTTFGAIAIALLCVVPLLTKRIAPLAASLVVIAIVLVGVTLVSASSLLLAPLIATGEVFASGMNTLRGKRRRALVGIAAAAVPVIAVTSGSVAGLTRSEVLAAAIAYALVFGLSVVWGYSLSQRDQLVESERQRADAVTRAAAIEHADRLRTERASIAAELHDEIAARLSAISLQAGALSVRASIHPELALSARAIRTSSTEAIEELQTLIRLLSADRASRSDDPTSDAHREIDPGISLQAAAEALGVRLDGAHDLPSVGAGVAEVITRIGREALVNAGKHAQGSPVAVHAIAADDEVTVAFTNSISRDAQPPPARGTGLGATLMRSRWESIGGTGTVGPDGSDWVVRFTLPTRTENE